MNALASEFNAGQAGQPRRVLVLESDRLLRELITEWLGLAGHEPMAKSDLAAGGVMARQCDLVLADVPAPNRAARLLVQRLVKVLPGTPVIAMSADIPTTERHGLETLSRQLGASALLVKPFTRQMLLSAIDSIRG